MLFKKKKDVIGIDIGSSSVKMVHLKEAKGGYQLAGLGLAMLPAEAIVDNAIMDSSSIVDIVRGLVESQKLKTKNVATSISGHSVIIRKIQLPIMTEEEMEASIQWEAEQYIPTDRIIDGIDQTALLMNGDTHGRRDYVFIYAGPQLGAIVKGNYKRHMISPDPVGEASGIPAAFYFLPADPREKTPMLVNLIHLKSPFNRMKLRHDIWKEKYPDSTEKHGVPWTGIANASPGLKAHTSPKMDRKQLPFDPLEYVEHLDQLPFNPDMDPGLGQ